VNRVPLVSRATSAGNVRWGLTTRDGVRQGRQGPELPGPEKELKEKRGIIFTNENVENVIRMVDVEIEKTASELARIVIETENNTNK